MVGEKDFARRFERIERGVREIEACNDAGLRATAQQLVQVLLELHASAIERLLEVVHRSVADGQAIVDQLGRDPLVSKLLLLHSLHPLSLEERVGEALETLRPTIRQQGDVELVDIVAGAVRVRLHGRAGLRATVEAALLDAAPDAATIEIEEVPGAAAVVGFVPLMSLKRPERSSAGVRTV